MSCHLRAIIPLFFQTSPMIGESISFTCNQSENILLGLGDQSGDLRTCPWSICPCPSFITLHHHRVSSLSSPPIISSKSLSSSSSSSSSPPPSSSSSSPPPSSSSSSPPTSHSDQNGRGDSDLGHGVVDRTGGTADVEGSILGHDGVDPEGGARRKRHPLVRPPLFPFRRGATFALVFPGPGHVRGRPAPGLAVQVECFALGQVDWTTQRLDLGMSWKSGDEWWQVRQSRWLGCQLTV